MTTTELHTDLGTAVREVCSRFPDTYWWELDAREAYPEELGRTLAEAGNLAALIPEERGGSGLGMAEASLILEEADVTMQTCVGYRFAQEYDVERKFRETRLCQTAPIWTNLTPPDIRQHVLDLPRSF